MMIELVSSSLFQTIPPRSQKIRMNRKVVQAKSLGSVAWESLSTGKSARVMGTTSRGVFLQTERTWLVFLSWEPWRGPLTVNVEAGLTEVDVGESVLLDRGTIWLGRHQVILPPNETWEPSPPPRSPSLPEERRERARSLLEAARRSGRVSTLAHLLDQTVPLQPHCLLGLGPGLTPSGDDLLAGALLTRARRGTAPDRPEGLLAAARARTTTLAWNLLELSARGLADERLVNLADHVNTGAPCDGTFLDWGSHSGVDVLLGMALEDRMVGMGCESGPGH